MNAFFQKLHDFLSHVGHQVLDFVGPLAAQIAASGGPVLIEAAAAAVKAAEATGGNGSAKLASAQTAVVDTLKAQGVPVVMNAVNGAIEAAVANLRAGQ